MRRRRLLQAARPLLVLMMSACGLSCAHGPRRCDSCGGPESRERTLPALDQARDLDTTDRLRQVLADHIRLEPGDQAADIGAGMGWFTARMARQVGPSGRIYATDIDPAAIAELRRTSPPWVEVRPVENPRDTGLDDLASGVLRLVLVINSVYFEDRPEDIDYLRRLWRVTEPGGRLIYHRDWVTPQKGGARRAAIQVFRQAGFILREEIPMLPDMPGTVCACILPEPVEWTRGFILVFERPGPRE